MTVMAPRSDSRTVSSSWHSSVAALPAERRPATPFHSREWAAVWQSVRTEQVRGRHHLLIPAPAPHAPGAQHVLRVDGPTGSHVTAPPRATLLNRTALAVVTGPDPDTCHRRLQLVEERSAIHIQPDTATTACVA